jgi:hypothetical protein
MTGLVLIGLNEVNFEFVERYAHDGRLPFLSSLMRKHGVIRTRSEPEYENIEPWIQWVSIQTGLPYEKHGVFRLGDITRTDYRQLWETVEALTGRGIVAICPMNARNAVSHSDSIFLPDPWTDTPASGPAELVSLSKILARFVNNNAGGALASGDYIALAVGLLRHSRLPSLLEYARIALTSRKASWRKALLLDIFLGDLLCGLVAARKPAFASIFLNAAAHIQHHYMLSSSLIEGGGNPEWYIARGFDPVLEAYETYDRIVATIAARNPGMRLMIATGLHQDPCPVPIYYWRPTDHVALVKRLGISCRRVQPRMSRDFLLEFDDSRQAIEASTRLAGITVNGVDKLFRIDVRQNDIFVEVIYGMELKNSDFIQSAEGEHIADDARSLFSFVAIKNGVHNQEGYLIDTGARIDDPEAINVQDVYKRIVECCSG